MGYICEETRCVSTTHQRSSHPSQGQYVAAVTRSINAGYLKDTNWMSQSKSLSIPDWSVTESTYDLDDPSSDPEVQPSVYFKHRDIIQAAWFTVDCQVLFLEVTNACYSLHTHSHSFQRNTQTLLRSGITARQNSLLRNSVKLLSSSCKW